MPSCAPQIESTFAYHQVCTSSSSLPRTVTCKPDRTCIAKNIKCV